MRPVSGRHAAGGFKITTLGRGWICVPGVTRVVRHERRTSLTASLRCWHAYPVGVFAVLTLAPGSSPWRLQSALAVPRPMSRTVTAGPGCGARDPPIWRRLGRLVFHAQAAPNRMFCRGDESLRAIKIPDPMPAVGPSLRPCATGGRSAGPGSGTTGHLLRRRGIGTCAQLQHCSCDAGRPNGSLAG